MFHELVEYSDKNGSFSLYGTIQTDVRYSIGWNGHVHYLFGFLSQFKCCGVNNHTDWLDYNTTWKGERGDDSNEIAPISCCVKNITDCNTDEKNLQTQVIALM